MSPKSTRHKIKESGLTSFPLLVGLFNFLIILCALFCLIAWFYIIVQESIDTCRCGKPYSKFLLIDRIFPDIIPESTLNTVILSYLCAVFIEFVYLLNTYYKKYSLKNMMKNIHLFVLRPIFRNLSGILLLFTLMSHHDSFFYYVIATICTLPIFYYSNFEKLHGCNFSSLAKEIRNSAEKIFKPLWAIAFSVYCLVIISNFIYFLYMPLLVFLNPIVILSPSFLFLILGGISLGVSYFSIFLKEKM